MKTGFHGDTLEHRERRFELIDQPLELYFELIKSRPTFEPTIASARGYAAHWVIEEGWLFLAGMTARWSEDRALQMNDLFPFAGSKVFAAWYSGQIRGYRAEKGLPDMSEPQRVRYPDLMLQVECGRMANTMIIDRRVGAAGGSRAAGELESARVIDLGDYRRAAMHGGWHATMV